MNTTTTPSVFKFHTHQVRTILKDGEPWFVASDVCKALGYLNTSKAVGDHLDADERMIALVPRTPNDSLGVETNTINESGLYALVLRSRKPEARTFAKWVTSEVLPAIRKTGKFDVKTSSGPLTEEMRSIIKAMVIERAKSLPVDQQAGAIIKAWSALKTHFGKGYKEIPVDQFAEALSLVARMQVEWELVEEVPSATGRHRRELVIVDSSGTRVIDATDKSLIHVDRVHALRRDFKVMQEAMVEMSHRMRICFGDINASDLIEPLNVNLGAKA